MLMVTFDSYLEVDYDLRDAICQRLPHPRSLMRAGARPQLLGFWMCVALVIGNSIGSGVFLLPAALAPYGLNSAIAWAFTACGAVLLAIVFARLSRATRGTLPLAIVGVIAALYSFWAIIGAGAEAVIWGGVLLLLGAPLYVVVRKKPVGIL